MDVRLDQMVNEGARLGGQELALGIEGVDAELGRPPARQDLHKRAVAQHRAMPAPAAAAATMASPLLPRRRASTRTLTFSSPRVKRQSSPAWV